MNVVQLVRLRTWVAGILKGEPPFFFLHNLFIINALKGLFYSTE